MGRKSSITKLDPRIRDSVDAAIRDGRATIDDIVLLIETMGGEVSRAAAGRYVRNATEQMQGYRKAQEMAKVWIGELKANPDGDVGRLIAEMLKMKAFQHFAGMEDGEKASAMDLMLLGKMLDHMAKSEKTRVDQALRIQKETAVKAAAAAVDEAKKGGASDELIETLKKRILGIGDK